MKRMFQFLCFCLLTPFCYSQTQHDGLNDSASRYFAEVKDFLQSKEANLWNHSLDGPLMFVERGTRKAYANQQDKEGKLTKTGSIYTGILPKDVNIANTAISWAGVKWTMVLLPLSKVPERRMRLVFHELFHRIQNELGFPGKSPTCSHLDSKEGRIYFRLELEALKSALLKPVNKRQKDLKAALSFRLYRFYLFKDARKIEQELEFNEGLCEFTGVYISQVYLKDKNYLADQLSKATENYPTFSRSSAYLTGPAYGILLSQKKRDWQKHITANDNFEDLLTTIYHLKIPDKFKVEVDKYSDKYNGRAIIREEEERENVRLEKVSKYMGLLVNGPVLELPHTTKNNFSFNPDNLFPLGEFGTVFPTLTMTDDWGRLVVTDVALIRNWSVTYVPIKISTNPSENLIKGPGWELELRKGWKIVEGKRQGDYKVSSE